jgi:hypothetical protein
MDANKMLGPDDTLSTFRPVVSTAEVLDVYDSIIRVATELGASVNSITLLVGYAQLAYSIGRIDSIKELKR